MTGKIIPFIVIIPIAVLLYLFAGGIGRVLIINLGCIGIVFLVFRFLMFVVAMATEKNGIRNRKIHTKL